MAQTINGIRLLTTKETAEKLGVSTTTIARLRTKGLLEYAQIGHHRLTSDEQIAMYLKGETKEKMQKLAMAEKLLGNLK